MYASRLLPYVTLLYTTLLCKTQCNKRCDEMRGLVASISHRGSLLILSLLGYA